MNAQVGGTDAALLDTLADYAERIAHTNGYRLDTKEDLFQAGWLKWFLVQQTGASHEVALRSAYWAMRSEHRRLRGAYRPTHGVWANVEILSGDWPNHAGWATTLWDHLAAPDIAAEDSDRDSVNPPELQYARPEEQEAIRLYFIDGLSAASVARRINRPGRTTQDLITRGMNRIRRALTGVTAANQSMTGTSKRTRHTCGCGSTRMATKTECDNCYRRRRYAERKAQVV